MKIAAYALVAVAPVCAAVQLVLYIIQGGFGAGHGRYDQWIYFLGLPSVLLAEAMSSAALERLPQITWLILLPGHANFITFGAIGLTLMRFSTRTADRSAKE
jgi:hypothetical protein